MAETPKFNLRNPAVKRIMQEMKEIKQDTSGDILAEALETDIFEWHFVIRGPQDTEFEGGIYHGRILLPAEYPFKPPSFMMLTPNGRFETNVKICLSISSHHPEHWQPSWSVRTALMALIAFMPSPGGGALGALDFPKDERRLLANRSRMEPPRFGSAERQRVIDDMHGRMLAVAIAKETVTVQDPTVVAREAECQESPSGPVTGAEVGTAARRQQQPENPGMTAPAGGAVVEGDGGLVRMGMVPEDKAGRTAADCCAAACVTAAAASGDVRAGGDRGADEATSSATTACGRMGPDVPAPAVGHASTSSAPVSAFLSYQPMAACSAPSASPAHVAAFAATSDGARASPAHLNVATGATNSGSGESMGGGRVGATSTDHMLTALMWALYVGIGAILLRKVMGAMGVDITEMLTKFE